MKYILFLICLTASMFANAQTTPELLQQVKQLQERGYETDDYKISDLLKKAIKQSPDNEQANYMLAEYYIKHAMYSYAYTYISKAIKANPLPQYYWDRVRCNMISTSYIDEFKQAVNDLDSMIKLGAKTATVYRAKAMAEKEIAMDYYKDAQSYKGEADDNSFSDVDTAKQSKLNSMYQESKKYALDAKESAVQSVKIKAADNDAAYMANEMDKLISDIDNRK